jgi:hypothetical protein
MARPGCSPVRPICGSRRAHEYQVCPADSCCPFFVGKDESCKISDAGVPLTDARQKFCRSDDYDGCPTYLGYLLRRTQPLRGDSDWLDAD